MSSSRRVTYSAIAALALAALPACSTVSVKGAKAQGEQVAQTQAVEKVNGVAITRGEVDRAVKALLAQYRMPAQLPPEDMKKAEETALAQLTSTELLYQQAQKVEIKDLDKQVQDIMAQGRKNYPSDAEYAKALQNMEMTEAQMTALTRKGIVINSFIEKEFGTKVSISDDEAKKFYEANKDRYFKHPESVRASHILIGVDGKATAEEKEKAKEKAQAILAKVKAGEDFAALAKAESSCPSKANGGDLGVFNRGRMVPAFEKAAFALKPGEVSEVVETNFGYHVIKVTEKHEAGLDTFEEVKGKIVDYLKRGKVQKLVADYLQDLRAKAKIEKV